MVQEFTLDEIAWRFEMLQSELIDDISHEELLNKANILPEDNDISARILSFASAALVLLKSKECIAVTLHKRGEIADAIFTATRHQCEKTSWIEPDPDTAWAYGTPAKSPMPIPILFHEKGNETYTHISLSFSYPNTHFGEFCKRMIGYLRRCYKKDVNVVNLVLFMQKYFTHKDAYIRALNTSLPGAFIEDFWNSRSQTPTEVDELMSMVLEDDAFEVYDPFMRTGSNLAFAIESKKYHAQATSKSRLYNTMFYCAYFGIETSNVKFEDCTTNWDPQNCDTIIATPELNMEVSTENGVEPISTWTLEKVFNSMDKEGRRGIMILPANVLTSTGKAQKLRHDITEANLIDTVVLLPSDLFPKTSIAVAVIMLKANREKEAPITFVDFTSFFYETDEFGGNERLLDSDAVQKAIDCKDSRYITSVSTDDIREAGYEWFTPKFVKKQTDVPAGYGRFKIKDIIYKNDIWGDSEWGWKIQILKESDMVGNPFDTYPELEVVERDEEEDMEGYNFFTHSSLIIDFNEGIKTYYFEETRDETFLRYKWAIPEHFYCYHINEDMIHIGYLRLLLFKTYYKTVLEIASNNQADIVSSLMNTEVTIPLTKEEQKQIYEQEKYNAALEKARKAGLDEAIDAMKQEYMMEVRMRKHDMKPFLSQLDSQAKLISFYMDKIEGNEEVVAAIRQKLTGISNAVSELRLHLNRLTEEDIYGQPKLINPLDVLKELTGTFNNYSVDMEVDKIALSEAGIESPEIYISRVDLSTLATTIIENAVAHAFTAGAHDYRVHISFTFDKEKDAYIIDFTNNGSPMPIGMDKFRYGLKGEKGAKSNGSGLGGYRVKSITRHFGGDYDVFCNRAKNLTTIRVTFPKYNKHEQV